MPTHPIPARAVLLLAVLALALTTACGGDDADTAAADDESVAAAQDDEAATEADVAPPATTAEEPTTGTLEPSSAQEETGGESLATEDSSSGTASTGGGSLLITADQVCEALTFDRIAEVTGLTTPADASPFPTGEGSCAYTMDGPTSVYVEVQSGVGAFDLPATAEGLEQFATEEERFVEVERISDLGDGAVEVVDEIDHTLAVLLGDQYLILRSFGEVEVAPDSLRTLALDLIG